MGFVALLEIPEISILNSGPMTVTHHQREKPAKEEKGTCYFMRSIQG
jgi:hypothetical protein